MRPTTAFAPFTVFAWFWAIQALVHQVYHGYFCRITPEMFLNVAALLLFLRPSSLWRFLLLCVVQLATIWVEMPYIYNHPMVVAIAEIVILLLALQAWLGSQQLNAERLHHLITQPLRIMLILTYLFAGLAKLNPDYFNPDLSSASEMYRWLVNKLPFLPQDTWAMHAANWGSVAIEFLIPTLLIFRRTRLLAMGIGLAFHTLLSINTFHDFTAVGVAFYILFLPPRWCEELVRFSESISRRFPWFDALRSSYATVGWIAVIFGVASFTHLGWVEFDAFKTWSFYRSRDVYLLFTMAAGAGFIWGLLKIGSGLDQSDRFPLKPLSYVGIVILVVNGMCPYIGLKTESSFTMFSNMQTEGELWNHYFMPRWLRVFPYQDDLVTIVESSHPVFQSAAENGVRFAYFGFHREALDHPDMSVTYEYRGEQRSVPRAGDDPELSRPQPYLLRKIFWFRRVSPPEANVLSH